MDNPLVFVGSYTSADKNPGAGISSYRLDADTGELTLLGVASELTNPTFLTLRADGEILYAVSEVFGSPEEKSGAAAYRVDRSTGALTFLGTQAAPGTRGPCHIAVDRAATVALVSNYGDGSLSAFPIGPDGALGPCSQHIEYEGSSVNPRRQKEPHAHSAVFSPDDRYAFVQDLGTDKIMQYRLDAGAARVVANDPPFVSTPAGAGPRHFAFHPSGRYAYVINELDNTVVVYRYDETHGTLVQVQIVPTLPRGFAGTSHCADIHLSPCGRFLYGSNRGHDSLVLYRVDRDSGRLALVGHEPTQGEHPRNFALVPGVELVLVANQDSDNIVSFRRNTDTGLLTPTGAVCRADKAVCLVPLTSPTGE